MIRKQFFFTFLLILYLFQTTNSFCIPCPNEDLTFSSYINCECPLSKFYDESKNKCVDFHDCAPFSKLNFLAVNPFSKITNLLRPLEILSKIFKTAKIEMPKELELLLKVFDQRAQDLKINFPSLARPILGPLMFANNDVLTSCGGNLGCVIRGIFKRKSNYELIFPKLYNVLEGLLKRIQGTLADLKEKVKESCAQGGCPLLDKLLKVVELLPRNVGEVKDLLQIVKQLGKYFFDEEGKQM